MDPDEKVSRSDANRARRLVPFQNLIWARPFINGFQEWSAETLDLDWAPIEPSKPR